MTTALDINIPGFLLAEYDLLLKGVQKIIRQVLCSCVELSSMNLTFATMAILQHNRKKYDVIRYLC